VPPVTAVVHQPPLLAVLSTVHVHHVVSMNKHEGRDSCTTVVTHN